MKMDEMEKKVADMLIKAFETEDWSKVVCPVCGAKTEVREEAHPMSTKMTLYFGCEKCRWRSGPHFILRDFTPGDVAENATTEETDE